MAGNIGIGGEGTGVPWRIIGWGAAALLLLVPLVANAPWTGMDYVFAALLFGGAGLGIELAARRRCGIYLLAAGAAIAAAFSIIWVNAAVGMIGSEDNPYNLLFGAVLVVALLGAIVARFRPAGMVWAMVAAPAAQAAVGGGGLSADPRGTIFSIGLAGLWLVAAALFRKAARGWSGER